MAKVIDLFPTPVMKVDGFADLEMINELAQQATSFERDENSATHLLSHTQMFDLASTGLSSRLSETIEPYLSSFGELLFGQHLVWTIKESWMNVLEKGGSQFLHTHANSFISGVLYITDSHPSAATIFHKPSGGGEFIFKNDAPMEHYSSDTWQTPDLNAGDLILFPSYLLHGVPPNDGDRRITLAFNAIPNQLSSLGYKINFSA